MARLPRLSGREVVRVFESLGWERVRQSSSHIILVREGTKRRSPFPTTRRWRSAHCAA
jgi:predicted RNA binding protein YcfA (HicA-like mRNA interferase family)